LILISKKNVRALFKHRQQLKMMSIDVWLSLVQVALACTRPFSRERMHMREVAINLHAIRNSYVAAIK